MRNAECKKCRLSLEKLFELLLIQNKILTWIGKKAVLVRKCALIIMIIIIYLKFCTIHGQNVNCGMLMLNWKHVIGVLKKRKHSIVL